jgi:hypothetical protein
MDQVLALLFWLQLQPMLEQAEGCHKLVSGNWLISHMCVITTRCGKGTCMHELMDSSIDGRQNGLINMQMQKFQSNCCIRHCVLGCRDTQVDTLVQGNLLFACRCWQSLMQFVASQTM